MSIPSADLVEIVTCSKRHAAPSESAHLSTTIDTIYRSNICATLTSSNSIFLKQNIHQHRKFLTETAQKLIKNVDIYGVNLAVADAIPRIYRDKSQIILFDGLQETVYFYTSLINVCTYLRIDQPGYTVGIDNVFHPAALQFSSAGFAILIDFLQTGRRLALISEMLTDQIQENLKIGYLGAILFIILHELGHIVLGHLDDKQIRSERFTGSLAYAESIDQYQRCEFDADLFALECIKPKFRHLFVPSMAFFLGTFIFVESFSCRNSTHPLSINRLKALIDNANMPTDARSVMESFIENQLYGLVRQVEDPRGIIDLRAHVLEVMPIQKAYGLVNFIKQEIAHHQGRLGLNYISSFKK